jgi:hypothetical protein
LRRKKGVLEEICQNEDKRTVQIIQNGECAFNPTMVIIKKIQKATRNVRVAGSLIEDL